MLNFLYNCLRVCLLRLVIIINLLIHIIFNISETIFLIVSNILYKQTSFTELINKQLNIIIESIEIIIFNIFHLFNSKVGFTKCC